MIIIFFIGNFQSIIRNLNKNTVFLGTRGKDNLHFYKMQRWTCVLITDAVVF